MKVFLKQKPWYFALSLLGFVIKPLLEELVLCYFDEKTVEKILQYNVTVFKLLPIGFFVFIIIICLLVWNHQIKHQKKEQLSTEQLTTINAALSNTIDCNEYVESMQAFQYKIKNANGKKYIKLSYISGIATEQIEINTILQTYFYFTYPIYKKISLISRNYDAYTKETNVIKKGDYKTDFLNLSQQLCDQILKDLNSIKNENEITELHCDMYRVLAKLLPAISETAIESFLKNNEIEMAIIKRKKTGLLGAIITKDLYIFKNKNSVTKKDRIYFAYPANTIDDVVFLGSIDGSCFPTDEIETIENYCKNIVTNTYNYM